MTDGPPESNVTQNNTGIPGMTAAEVTSLVNLFNGMLLAMEGRLTAKMDESSRRATDRWAKHDLDAQTTMQHWTDQFVRLEGVVDAHVTTAEAHWAAERDEELILAARIKPVKTTVQYLASNWRTILLLIVSALAILGFSTRTFQEILGG